LCTFAFTISQAAWVIFNSSESILCLTNLQPQQLNVPNLRVM
jgi:hypothetical protein